MTDVLTYFIMIREHSYMSALAAVMMSYVKI